MADSTPVLILQDPLMLQFSSTVCSFLAVAITLLTLSLVAFMVYVHDGKILIQGPKNIRLLLFLICVSVYFGAASMDSQESTFSTRITRSTFFALSLVLNMSYNWLRTIDIIHNYSSVTVVRGFHALLYITYIVCFFPPCIQALPLKFKDALLYHNVTTAVSATLVLILESFFAFSCAKQLSEKTLQIRELKGEDSKAALYYPIVAKYGIWTSGASFVALGLYILYVYLNATAHHADNLQFMGTILILTELVLGVVPFSLVAMKVKLVLVSKGKIVGLSKC
ncbi:hypothetical protein BDR26DRAFT_875174 [Obelidium mucronatum]|nr:hypothetical protein BDR26DRAFT_875174 [Obelidium mucronatum]